MTQLDKAGDTKRRQHLRPNASCGGYARVSFAFRNEIAARQREKERELVSEIEM